MKTATFREYVTEVLKNAIYEKFEEARENLMDAIYLWVIVGLKRGEEMPVVNGCHHRSYK